MNKRINIIRLVPHFESAETMPQRTQNAQIWGGNAVSDTDPLQASSTFPLFFLDLDQRPKSSFFLIFCLVRAQGALYRPLGSKLFPCPEPGVESNIIKDNILNLTSGPVSRGNTPFRILGFITRGYSRCYLVATVCLYPHRDGIPYTLRILPGSDRHPNSLEDLE